MKDFFRPTKAKIILMLVIPLYIGLVTTIGEEAGSAAITTWQASWVPFIALFFGALGLMANNENFFKKFSSFSFFENVGYFALEIVLPLLINYLLACLVMYCYHRIRHPSDQGTKSVPS